jgi:hypothetical protein
VIEAASQRGQAEGVDPYDRSYAAVDDLFGAEPEPVLLRYLPQLDPALPVLDIGAGQGRNALVVARAGLETHALDPSEVGLETIARRARGERLPVRTVLGSFDDHHAGAATYGGILCFGLVPDLSWESIHRLRDRTCEWLAPRGLLWLTGFTTEDSALPRFRRSWQEIGENSFVDPTSHGGDPSSPGAPVRTYLCPGQVLGLFEGLEVVHHWQGLGDEHRHGDGPPERHARFEAVLRAPNSTA